MIAPAVRRIELPQPAGWQPRMLADPAPYKVLNGGRRSAKTVAADYASIVGHGPTQPDGTPLHKGIAQGLDVIWIPPDATQNKMLWRNTVEKRYRGIDPRIDVNASDKYVSLTQAGGGTLWYSSMENIRAVRGAGAGLAGVVVEEAAHVDLEAALFDVIGPALTDEGAWLILLSTPNEGLDGNTLHRTPSYFNLLCQEIMAGKRGQDWSYYHVTVWDNPAISPRKRDRFIALYPDKDDPKYLREVMAELLQAGLGLAFANQWDKDVHLTRDEPSEHCAAAAGLDWGYEAPGHFALMYTEPNGQRLLRYEMPFKGMRAVDVGKAIGELALRAQTATGIRLPEIVHDASMANDNEGGPTIVEKVEEGCDQAFRAWNRANDETPGKQRRRPRKPPEFIPAPKGDHGGKPQRAVRKDIMHDLLHFVRDVDGVLVQPPKLRVHVDCPAFTQCITTLARDPKGKEDVATDGNDHAYDSTTYMELARVVRGERAALTRAEQAELAALDPLSRQAADEWAQQEAKWARQAKRTARR